MTNDIFLKINMKCMLACGTVPLQLNNGLLNLAYRIYSNILKYYLILFLISSSIEVASIIGQELSEIAENLTITLLVTTTVWKMLICSKQRMQKLTNQLQDLEEQILSYQNTEIKRIYHFYVYWNYIVNHIVIWQGVLATIPYFVSPILIQLTTPPIYGNYTKNNVTVEYPIRPLPLSSWFPFNKHLHYRLCFTYHVFALIIGAAMTITADILLFGHMIFVIGQLRILQYCFKNVTVLALSLKVNSNISYGEALECALIYCIKMHKFMIRYVEDLDKIMRSLMLLDFVVASIQMAMLGLQMMMTGFGFQQVSALVFLVAMFTQLFLFYWHANEISVQSLEIAHAIWDSDWIHYNDKLKKDLIMVILRSQKPLSLSVGPFYTMSTQVALSILRASYSYVAIIIQMYNRKS